VEIHQLRYFVSVAEIGSFTRAAQACYVAQPSLSQQIRKLEEELGQALFERLGRRVRLTAAGHILYERADSHSLRACGGAGCTARSDPFARR
jgi:DNA-binding transcriptional LysR family regulator